MQGEIGIITFATFVPIRFIILDFFQQLLQAGILFFHVQIIIVGEEMLTSGNKLFSFFLPGPFFTDFCLELLYRPVSDIDLFRNGSGPFQDYIRGLDSLL